MLASKEMNVLWVGNSAVGPAVSGGTRCGYPMKGLGLPNVDLEMRLRGV